MKSDISPAWQSTEDCIHRLRNLHRNKVLEVGEAPHKPALLIAVIDLIDKGVIRENTVYPAENVVAAYSETWQGLPIRTGWRLNFVYPFWHLTRDGIWSLLKSGAAIEPSQENRPKSMKQLRSAIDYARFHDSLWEKLQDASKRTTLRQVLLEVIDVRTGEGAK